MHPSEIQHRASGVASDTIIVDQSELDAQAGLVARRLALRNLTGLAVGALLYGCGGGGGTSGGGSGGAITPPVATNPQPAANGPTTAATVTVTNTAVGMIGSGFVGLSYEKNSMALPRFSGANTDLIGMFRTLGPSLLRIGGNSVDQTQWAATGPGLTAGQVAPSDIDRLAAFLAAAGWKVLYGINLATSTPAAAAAEVAYAVESLGASLYAIEIGNEPDLYQSNSAYTPPATYSSWSLAAFEYQWGLFRAAILQASPNVVITGPADASNITTWTVPFGEAAGKQEIALLTQHYYRANGESATSTAAFLITPDTALVGQLAELSSGATQIGIPFRLTETNSFYNGGASGVSDSYASSLWVIDHMFTIALGGGVGANLHGGGGGAGYTPIADNNGVVVEARPEYYGLLLVTLAGQGNLLQTSIAAGGLNATAYAVDAAGGKNLVIVNKDLTQTLTVTITCPNAVGAATLLLMQGPSLGATSGVTIQGVQVEQSGAFVQGAPYTLSPSGNSVTCTVPALSAALVTLT